MIGRHASWLCAALLACVGLAACTVAPRQAVLPYPDHISAAISVGDRVEITTVGNEELQLEVTAVTEHSLIANGVSVDFNDIRTIAVRSFVVPRNPCDDERPLDCSVPRLARIASAFHDRFAEYFRPSCRQHDYCYRYGKKTYGFERSDCDRAFLDAMWSQCSGKFNLDLAWRAECAAAAQHFYSAVAEHGAASFPGEDGETCEYAGPRASVVNQELRQRYSCRANACNTCSRRSLCICPTIQRWRSRTYSDGFPASSRIGLGSTAASNAASASVTALAGVPK